MSFSLECDSCGTGPGRWDLLNAAHRPGDICPCCYLDDYDCDGVLYDPAISNGMDRTTRPIRGWGIIAGPGGESVFGEYDVVEDEDAE
jgi:hypothetical protein